MAAARLCDELVHRALGRYAIAVIGAEPQLAYNRILLSSVLAGDVPASETLLKPASWWRDRGVTLRYGAAATAVDTAARTVTLDDGKMLGFAQARLRHRLARHSPAGGRQRSARRPDVPRLGRRGVNFRGGASRRARRRDRRRAVGHRSGLWPRQSRRQGHARSPHGSPDGTSARCARRFAPEARRRSEGRRGPA